MSKKVIAILALPLFVLVLSGCSFLGKGAKDQKGADQTKGEKGKTPTEMTAACSGKSEGDSCEATMPASPSKDGKASTTDSNKVAGTCKKSQDDQLVCMGAGGEQRGPGGPGASQAQPNAK
jgi:hypothetical protein